MCIKSVGIPGKLIIIVLFLALLKIYSSIGVAYNSLHCYWGGAHCHGFENYLLTQNYCDDKDIRNRFCDDWLQGIHCKINDKIREFSHQKSYRKRCDDCSCYIKDIKDCDKKVMARRWSKWIKYDDYQKGR